MNDLVLSTAIFSKFLCLQENYQLVKPMSDLTPGRVNKESTLVLCQTTYNHCSTYIIQLIHLKTLYMTQNKHIKLAPTIILQTLVLQVHVKCTKCEHVPNTKQHTNTYTHHPHTPNANLTFRLPSCVALKKYTEFVPCDIQRAMHRDIYL